MVLKRKIIIITVSILVTCIFALLFSKSIFLSENQIMALDDYSFLSQKSDRYSEEEIKVLSEIVKVSGYTIKGNEFIRNSNNAKLTYILDKKKINHIEIILREMVHEDVPITVELFKNKEPNAIITLLEHINVGESDKTFDFISDEYDMISFEIGKDAGFVLDRIIIGEYKTDYATYQHFLYLQLMFFSTFFIIYQLQYRKGIKDEKR